MSHLTCDWGELSLRIWLENSFSAEPQKWAGPQRRHDGVRGWHVAQHKSVFIDTHEWLLQVLVSLRGRTLRKKTSVEMCWKYAASLCCLSPKNKRHRNMNCSTRCLWTWRASWCVQRVHIISEPPQCQLFRNQEKRLFIFSLTAARSSRRPEGCGVLTGREVGWYSRLKKRTINEPLHVSEVNMKITKSWRWWDFCSAFDGWSKCFSEQKKLLWQYDLAERRGRLRAGHDQSATCVTYVQWAIDKMPGINFTFPLNECLRM